MDLLTIGEFARTSGLTPKALRLYGDLRLLVPAAVDAETGYRYYHRGQLTRAELIVGLRHLGMPLARIRTVCDLPPPAAAQAVTDFWQAIATGTADRAHLAASLAQQLSGRTSAMTEQISVRHAATCDAGADRDTNEDVAYAGDHLLAVADGTRGPGGAAASAAAVDGVRALERTDAPPAELLAGLTAAVTAADSAVRALATDDHRPATTLTALLLRGTQLALVHIGDTRAYLLRNRELYPLTQDHTWVQAQVDQGLLSPSDAAAHPRRALLVRALGAGDTVEADLALRTAIPGDRYLLCSDGLSAVVDRSAVHDTLTAHDDPQATVDRLIALAYAAGAPDNIACVVADIS